LITEYKKEAIMNQIRKHRFTIGLSSGLTIVTLLTVGSAFYGDLSLAAAADKPVITNNVPATGTDNEKASTSSAPGSAVENRDRVVGVDEAGTKPVAAEPATIEGKVEELGLKTDRKEFVATAYCLKGRTASGVFTRPGVIAADPRVLPLGTKVHIEAGGYSGIYTVLDTGGMIKGNRIDIYIPTYTEAMLFGRRTIKVKILSKPSNPLSYQREKEPEKLVATKNLK
jgi:3D (Asp-Asp-Asp) domain-containing protein